MLELTAKNVEKVFFDCMFKDSEVKNNTAPINAITVDGIMAKFAFHPERTRGHKEEIQGFLNQLKDEFTEEHGGGATFIHMPFTKDDRQWGEQRNAEQLLVIAIAVGLAEYLMPRAMWKALPGGMPYIKIEKTNDELEGVG